MFILLNRNYFNTSYVTVQRNSQSNSQSNLIDFNTSYVTVQPHFEKYPLVGFEFQYILCYGSTLVFFSVTALDRGFQYILCYGSTVDKIRGMWYLNYFNTSYVTVQPLVLCDLYFLSYRKTIDTTSVYKNFSNDRHFFQKRTKNRL